MPDRFRFDAGDVLAGKYEIVARLGGGWEGEVFRIRERGTGIERAAKLFYPKRNPNNRTAITYAKKLHKLSDCSVLIHYHTSETVEYGGSAVTALISEYVEGEPLSEFVHRSPARRLTPFEGAHLLHALASGIEEIHLCGESHGDLHEDNVIVQRFGLTFELKVLDLWHHGRATRADRRDDVISMVRIFYDALGGPRRYSTHPQWVRDVCRGLKHSLIVERFPTAGALRLHLETVDLRRSW